MLITAACNLHDESTGEVMSSQSIQSANKPQAHIEFINSEHDFGIITAGETVGCNFRFKNTGTANLLIHDANASCGCTIPKWDREPVKPGSEGFLEVKFDSSGRTGIQQKTVTVKSNAENEVVVLLIKAEVVSE